MTDTAQLPEAPASVTVKVKSEGGFEYLFTMRDDRVGDLLEKMGLMEKYFAANKYTPAMQGFGGFNKPKAPEKPCPKHVDKMLRERIDKKGEKYWSHAQGIYPNLGEWCNGAGYPSERTQNMNQEYDLSDVPDF